MKVEQVDDVADDPELEVRRQRPVQPDGGVPVQLRETVVVEEQVGRLPERIIRSLASNL